MKRLSQSKVAECYEVPITGADKPRQKRRKIGDSYWKMTSVSDVTLTSDKDPKTKIHSQINEETSHWS